MGSVVKGITGAITGSSGADAASSAAKTQAAAANNAAKLTQDQFNQMRTDLAPYRALGTGSMGALYTALGYTPTMDASGNLTGLTANPNSALQKQFNFTGQDLANTPGYQFTLNQGLKSTNNALAAQGLGLSGAQAKGLSQYATGLADQTYNEQYNNALSGFNTNYQVAANNANNLMSLLSVGQNAATQTGVSGLNAANTAGGYLTSGANAIAAGKIGSANAYANSPLTSGLAQAGSLYGLSALLGSDRRIKKDIKRVGATDEGLPIYTYRYKGDDPRVYMGVMAQELEELHPEAVTEIDGIKHVNYDLIPGVQDGN